VRAMIWYRLYDLEDDHIVAARDFEAIGDVAALDLARELAHGEDAELWSGPRKIGRIVSAAVQKA
jgi:hypothetical protein